MSASSPSFRCLLLVGGLLCVFAAGGARAAERRVAVLTALSLDAAADSEQEARASASAAIRAQGAEPVVPAPTSTDGLCRAGHCIREFGLRADASEVLRLQAVYANDGFKLRVEIWSTAEPRLRDSRERDCEVCTLNDLHRAIREVTTVLCARTLSAPADGPMAVVAPAVGAPPLEVRTTAARPLDEGETFVGRPAWRTGVASVLAGGALVGAGLAVYYFAIDGSGTCEKPDPVRGGCPRTYATRNQGFAFLGITAGLTAAAALIWLPDLWSSPSVAVGLTGNGVMMRGAF
jgi:hypothetical protein